MRVAVFGLWHLGSVTAACLAEAGNDVVGLDLDPQVIAGLQSGRAPLHEPGLDELLATGLSSGKLSFTTDPAAALAEAEVVWVAFDTPVDDFDRADVDFVRRQLDAIAPHLKAGQLLLTSSQVPAGFTAELAAAWAARGLRYAYSPENLRLGAALKVFRQSERIVVGVADEQSRAQLATLLTPFCERIEWMSVASAEMTKHALNAFLATSVAFANELARLCENCGADAREVERGLKSEARIGPKAYLSPGDAFAGGTLARDLRYLVGFGTRDKVATPLFSGVLESNDIHKGWVTEKLDRFVAAHPGATATLLGLTYKPGTDALRRSSAVEHGRWLHARGIRVQAFDPAVKQLPSELQGTIELCPTADDALRGASIALVATRWPELRALNADQLLSTMRQACVIDPSYFLADALAGDSRVRYIATGRAAA